MHAENGYGDFSREFEKSLSYDITKEIISEIKNHHVNLQIPKFEYDSEFKLREVLARMGMPIAFSTDADFSGMTDSKGLFIDEVIHKAFVSVEEVGTEAAAATAIMMRGSSSSDEPISVSVNRPFIFIIRDVETGAILFVGLF